MKKFLLAIFVLAFCLNVKAQTSLTEAVNFTSYDDYDKKIELFNILDRGQFVFMYFFFTDASTSEVFDPYVASAYHHFGDNQEDVFFLGIAPSDDSLSVDGWKSKYGVDFPVIHWYSEGEPAQNICASYGVKMFSTAVLIAPNRQIIIDNIWPIESAQQLIDEFETAMATIDVAEINADNFNVYPNPASSEFNIVSSMLGEADVNIYDMAGRCVKNIRLSDISNATVNISDIEKGVYIVDVNGKMTKLVIE